MTQDLWPNERAIDTWTLFYITPEGARFSGKLLVTNQRVVFDAKFDGTATGMMTARAASGRLEIDKRDIVNVTTQKSFLKKKALVTLNDGSVHTFDYGAMNIDKCVAAIEAR